VDALGLEPLEMGERSVHATDPMAGATAHAKQSCLSSRVSERLPNARRV
jgi:hypothetical protein